MLARAPIRPAGRMSRTLRVMTMTAIAAALVAGHATSQTVTPGSDVTNNQDQGGDVIATQTLTVVENDGLTSATGQATGNSLQGGNQGVDATLTTTQMVRGTIRAANYIEGVNTGAEDLSLGTPVYSNSQAVGNYVASTAVQGNLTVNGSQTATGPIVQTINDIHAPNNAIYVSGEGDSTSEVNHTAFQVTQGRLLSNYNQSSATDARADVSATVHYSPSPNAYNATATNNYYASFSDDRGSQEHNVVQNESGSTIARSEVYGGNMWLMSSQATATGNNVDLQNQGGSLVVDNKQTQTGALQAQSVVQIDQYGEAHAAASGIGNQMAAGNNDVYVRVDNDQLSSGGVDVIASFQGNDGYDADVTADAVGNQALAYACAECKADFGVNSSNQVNDSDVNATATAAVLKGRSIVATARATGNSATYYVSGGTQ